MSFFRDCTTTFRNTHSPLQAAAAAAFTAAFVSWSPLAGSAAADTPLKSLFGETNIQMERLSHKEHVHAESAQILVDAEGVASVFWVEFPDDEQTEKFYFVQRHPDGVLGMMEEWDFHQFFTAYSKLLWGRENEPCLTFFGDWDSKILRLRCKTETGWEVLPIKGYAAHYPLEMAFIVDDPFLQTAYVASRNSEGYALFFGETALKGGDVDVYSFDLSKDDAGVYYLAYRANLVSDHAYLLSVLSSEDGGRTWKAKNVSGEFTSALRLFLSRDGTLYLFWTEPGTMKYLYRSEGSDWRQSEMGLGKNQFFGVEDILCGEDENGNLYILLHVFRKIFLLQGSAENGFSSPELLWDMQNVERNMEDLSFAVGKDGALFFAWTPWNPSDHYAEPAYFGWLPPGG
jgi:hypothetical protein